MAERRARGWLRKGCLGCTGVLVLTALVVAALLLLARGQVRNDEHELSETTRDLEAATLRPVTPEPAPPEPIVLDLEIAWADVRVISGEEGEPLGLSARFDPDRTVLEVSTEEEARETGTLAVRCVPRGSRTLAALHPFVGGEHPKLEISVPSGVPVGIRGTVGGGISVFDLSGLWLTEVDLTMRTGIMQVQFLEPTARPVDSIRLDARRGNMVLYRIGHASPRRLSIHQGMGPGFFDLVGDWRTDSDVEVSVAFGSGHLRLPEGVGVRGLERRFARYNRALAAGPAEFPPPVLDMDVQFDVGNIVVTVVPEE
jgi:hypothetical protein